MAHPPRPDGRALRRPRIGLSGIALRAAREAAGCDPVLGAGISSRKPAPPARRPGRRRPAARQMAGEGQRVPHHDSVNSIWPRCDGSTRPLQCGRCATRESGVSGGGWTSWIQFGLRVSRIVRRSVRGCGDSGPSVWLHIGRKRKSEHREKLRDCVLDERVLWIRSIGVGDQCLQLIRSHLGTDDGSRPGDKFRTRSEHGLARPTPNTVVGASTCSTHPGTTSS